MLNIRRRKPNSFFEKCITRVKGDSFPGCSSRAPMVLDLACGSGRDAVSLSRRGWHATGVFRNCWTPLPILSTDTQEISLQSVWIWNKTIHQKLDPDCSFSVGSDWEKEEILVLWKHWLLFCLQNHWQTIQSRSYCHWWWFSKKWLNSSCFQRSLLSEKLHETSTHEFKLIVGVVVSFLILYISSWGGIWLNWIQCSSDLNRSSHRSDLTNFK